jgi:hypothetical protein
MRMQWNVRVAAIHLLFRLNQLDIHDVHHLRQELQRFEAGPFLDIEMHEGKSNVVFAGRSDISHLDIGNGFCHFFCSRIERYHGPHTHGAFQQVAYGDEPPPREFETVSDIELADGVQDAEFCLLY